MIYFQILTRSVIIVNVVSGKLRLTFWFQREGGEGGGGVWEFLWLQLFFLISAGGLGIPVVLVIVEGGTDAIHDAMVSLEHNIPVVVCSGTQRAADILAYAYSHTRSK
jgi:hypothetical protein